MKHENIFMSYWKHREIKLSEIQLGNLFYVPTVRTVIISGIHMSGAVQIADFYSGEIIQQNYTVKNLKPIDLPNGANIVLLEDYLKNTLFKKTGTNRFEMPFEDSKIIIDRDMLSWPEWNIYSVKNQGEKNKKKVTYVHELQNHFTFLTNARLPIVPANQIDV